MRIGIWNSSFLQLSYTKLLTDGCQHHELYSYNHTLLYVYEHHFILFYIHITHLH